MVAQWGRFRPRAALVPQHRDPRTNAGFYLLQLTTLRSDFTSESTRTMVTGYSPAMLRSSRCHGEMGAGRETHSSAALQEALTSQGQIW